MDCILSDQVSGSVFVPFKLDAPVHIGDQMKCKIQVSTKCQVMYKGIVVDTNLSNQSVTIRIAFKACINTEKLKHHCETYSIDEVQDEDTIEIPLMEMIEPMIFKIK